MGILSVLTCLTYPLLEKKCHNAQEPIPTTEEHLLTKTTSANINIEGYTRANLSRKYIF